MAYSLDLLTLLVVEDNELERTLVCNMLKAMGVGRTLTADNGADAAERLKLVKNSPLRAGASRVDVVLTDVLMPRMGGLDLLRWIRNSENSPNPFLPVMMVSADTDRVSVTAARDAGANEFVAKPVTVAGLAQRMLMLIDRPRDFVYCRNYFGPDRRRSDADGVDDERRTNSDDDVRVVHSDDALKSVDPGGVQVLHFRLPNELRNRVGGRPGRIGELSAERLKKAGDVLTAETDEFLAFVLRQVATVTSACKKYEAEPDKAAEQIKTISGIARDLATQGTGFNYPLLSLASRSLYEHIRSQTEIGPAHMLLVKAHTDFIVKVVEERVTGNGGASRRELLVTLKRARQLYEQRPAEAA